MDDLIHFNDITEPGVYQPEAYQTRVGDVSFHSHYKRFKLIAMPNGSGPNTFLNKIWVDQIDKDDGTVMYSSVIFSYSEEQLESDKLKAGYTSILYRKCDNLEYYVGIKLKE